MCRAHQNVTIYTQLHTNMQFGVYIVIVTHIGVQDTPYFLQWGYDVQGVVDFIN